MREEQKKRLGVGTILGIILCVILIPILLVNIYMIVQGLVRPEKLPSLGGYSPLIVLSDSMYPEIQSGDLILVHRVDAAAVKEGDIIAFFDPESDDLAIVTHRVVKIVEENGARSFQTKGDANNTEDAALVPEDALVGAYGGRIAGAGNVAMFLRSTPGLVICVAVPMALLIASELLRRRKYEKARERDTKALMAELEALRAKQDAEEPPEEPQS